MNANILDNISDILLNRKMNRKLDENMKEQQRLYDMVQFLQTQNKKMQKKIDYQSLMINEINQRTHCGAINYFNSKMMENIGGKDSTVYKKLEELRNIFSVMKITDKNFNYQRIGRDFDGGYIMLDDFSNSHIAYSFGINDDVSWDQEMADKGLQIYMYDHTINDIPYKNEHFHYFKIGICGRKDSKEYFMKSLPEIIKMNGHEKENEMILKLDVEGAEWSFLDELSIPLLKQFRQIVMELHDLNNPTFKEKIIEGISNIKKTHELIHVHANNYGSCSIVKNVIMPDVLEVTYLNKDRYQFIKSNEFFPNVLDMPNNPRCPDIVLGNW